MALKKVLGALKKIAPVAAGVATATGILPPGVARALGVAPDASPETIEAAAVKADPSQLAELRRIEADLAVHLRELDIRQYEAEAKDRDSAREREIKTGDSTPKIFAWVSLGGFLGLVYLLAFREIPEDNDNLIYAAVGVIGTILSQVAAYYFGSSAGSKDKDAASQAAVHAAIRRGERDD